MNKKNSHARFIEIPASEQESPRAKSDDTEYDDLELLEHLESLQEEMEDLGVSTLAEIIERITELHQKLDEE
jgi:hypothetical protein